jgi:DNA polymerase III alpha subunit
MDMGLFGAEDMNTQITFTQKFETNTMEKLMMEYDTLKSFVSSHPFDGLYRYLKRFSFISQFKNVENAGVFIIVGYIKSIQRARKKGVFVLVEDISGQTEFFLRDMLDLKKFDIVIIHGYKGRNASIDKIIKTSRSRLIKKA